MAKKTIAYIRFDRQTRCR